ncbi:ComEA family DNA-binding protein [Intrasporangium flavum]|uniref:ComEA family DNA-binding protein n=1 Tax=Intrasporangium flavum TaxID=1428657 RepID=UPI001F611AA2|nr:ComEA family DNA-binding protein [Intrasporangium flavum]
MPRRPRRPADLRRVAAILADGRDTAGWVPEPPTRAEAVLETADDREDEGVGGSLRDGLERVGLGGVGDLLGGLNGSEGSEADEQTRRLDADLRRARRPGLLTVPDEVRSGRRSVSTTAVVSLLALVVAVGSAFVVRVLWAERSAAGPVEGPGRAVSVMASTGTSTPDAGGVSTAPGASGPSGASASSAGAPAATAAATLVVHVVGQVNRPGLVRLAPGSRVADAITAAGGARRGADLSALNLARLVVDGEQVHVPRPGEAVTAGAGRAAASGGTGDAGGGSGGALVSLNTADLAALDTLPGVGPVLAQRILDWRTEHGRFTSVDELGEVSGIGDKLMERLRPKVTL